MMVVWAILAAVVLYFGAVAIADYRWRRPPRRTRRNTEPMTFRKKWK
jgi:hypothetical protein